MSTKSASSGAPPHRAFAKSLTTAVALASFLTGCGSQASAPIGAPNADEDGGDVGMTAEQPFSSDPAGESRRRALEGPFLERVVRFSPGVGAGFGAGAMPWVVQGGPRGDGAARGSLDVLSLGTGGRVEIAFDRRPIVDGAGPDFLVFENAFRYGPGGSRTYAEWARVSVSEDGETWVPFPCDTATGRGCAGGQPVFANVDANDLTCTDPSTAGGDAFDLASIGVMRARFVRIEDEATFPVTGYVDGKAGFDLDAIAAIHADSR